MRERDKSAGRTANENYAAGLRFSQPRIAAVWGGKVSVGTLRIIRF
jgi:hypothetical protein